MQSRHSHDGSTPTLTPHDHSLSLKAHCLRTETISYPGRGRRYAPRSLLFKDIDMQLKLRVQQDAEWDRDAPSLNMCLLSATGEEATREPSSLRSSSRPLIGRFPCRRLPGPGIVKAISPQQKLPLVSARSSWAQESGH